MLFPGPMVLRVALFLLVITALDALVHAYLYIRLVRRPGWRRPAVRRALTAALIVLAALIPLGMTASRWLPREVGLPVAFAAYTWMGVHFYLLLLFGLDDLLRLVVRRRRSSSAPPVEPPEDPGRRRALEQGAVAAISGAAAGLSAFALREGLADLTTPEVEVRLDRLPPTLSGLTLVQLSDVHIGPTIGKRFLEMVVDKVNQLRPDAVVITGDLVDGPVPMLFEHVRPLGRLRSRYGTFFVTGNHEFYSGAGPWVAALRRLGIRVLQNEATSLAEGLDLIGLDDWSVYRADAKGHGDRLLRTLVPDRERIVLAHQPRAIEEVARLDAGLQLAGHTHGGQLFPFAAAVALTTPYVAGLYRHDPRTQIYVSRGTGYWGPPMRLFAPAEITRIALV